MTAWLWAEESEAERGLLYKGFGTLGHNEPFVEAPVKGRVPPANSVAHIESIHQASHCEWPKAATELKHPPNPPSLKVILVHLVPGDIPQVSGHDISTNPTTQD